MSPLYYVSWRHATLIIDLGFMETKDVQNIKYKGYRLATYNILGEPRPGRIIELREQGWEPVYDDLRLIEGTGMILVRRIRDDII